MIWNSFIEQVKKMPKLKDTSFTAGLLQDIGKVILNGFMIDELALIREFAEEKNVSFLEAEKEI